MRALQRYRAVVWPAVVVVAAIAAQHVESKATASPSARLEDFARVDSLVRHRMETTRTPGLAYAVVDSNRILHQRTWGSDGDGEPVTNTTLFLWGSVSKPVTATAIMTLVEAGRLELDVALHRYLPWFRLTDEVTSSRITVRQLLEQTSGIPEGTGLTDRFDEAAEPYRSAVEDLAGFELAAEPGERHEYTSANYLVLGAVVEAVTGRRFDEYLHEAVLGPLDMTAAITTPAHARADLPPGHRYVAGRPVAMTAPYDAAGASYGYLGGTVVDLAHFAIAQLNGGRFAGRRVLTTESVETMHAGAVQVGERHSYGLGWRDIRRDGLRLVWHGGAAPGYQAMIVLVPEHHRGVVVLQNVYGFFQDSDLAAVGLSAAQMLAGEQPTAAEGDLLYALLLAVISAGATSLLAALGWSIYRLVRPGRRSVTRRRAAGSAALWTLAGGGIAVMAGVLLPAAFGVRLRDISLYAPDFGWLLIIVTGLAALLVPVRLLIAYRRARSRDAATRLPYTAGHSPRRRAQP